MNEKNYQNDLIDLFYRGETVDLSAVAKKYGVSLQTCEHDWAMLQLISDQFQELPELDASELSLQKVSAHAREVARERTGKSFWSLLFSKPAYVFASVFFIGFMSFYIGTQTTWFDDSSNNNVAVVTPKTDQPQDRLLRTPLDHYPFASVSNFTNLKKPTGFVFNNVSTGSSQNTFDIDDALEQKMLYSQDLSHHDFETLFFRARKLEKLGYYEQALNDYLYLAKFNPTFQQQSLPLALARCYEKIGHKQQAIQALEQYQKLYGSKQDIGSWIDQLKSETF